MDRNTFRVDLLAPINTLTHTVDVLEAHSELSYEELDHIEKKAERIMLAAVATKRIRFGKN